MGRGAGPARRARPVSRLPAGAPAEARPGPVLADLHGRQPVRIRAEGTDLVAYGFGEQRISVPARSVSHVIILGAYHELPIWSPLILLDRDKRVLLEAPGMWGPELNGVLQRLGLPRPVLSASTSARSWARAPGYQKLRVRPPGYPLARGTLVVAGTGLAGLGAGLGLLPTLAWLSSETWAQGVSGMAGAAAGGVAGAWLALLGARAAQAVARWAVAAWSVRTPPPVTRFFPEPREADGALLTAVTVLAVPALICWGPVVAAVMLAHGTASAASLAFAALSTAALPVMAWRAIRRLRDRQRRPRRKLARELW